MLLNDHLTDRQSQPCAICLRGDERVENAGQFVGVDPGAGILQRDGNGMGIMTSAHDADDTLFCGRGHCLDGVLDELRLQPVRQVRAAHRGR